MLLGGALAMLGASLGLAQSAEDLHMTVGKSVVIDYPSDIRQISTSSPDIVDASPVTTREILLHGKGLGSATMVVWSKTGQRTFYNVTVDLNLDPLRRLLKDSFPSDEIQAYTSRDSIALNGRVSSKDVQDRAMALAAAFSKTVVNNMQLAVAPIERQILLRVKFAELDRSKELQFGVNLLAAPGNNMIGASTGQFPSGSISGTITVPPTASQGASTSNGSTASGSNSSSTGTTTASTVGNAVTYTISQALNLFALDPKLNMGAFLKALQSESILQVLAEPNLVTTNGKEASFLVGGEFPVPVLQGGANSGAVTVQFREFGIRLIFTPVVTPNKTIKLHLRQEVSTLDPADGVTVNGFTIPALSTRRAETDVELGEGQSFVVAGLVNNQEQETFSKIPVLSSLPIFGSLFKTRDEKKSRTDLVLLVTPEITEPLGSGDPKPSVYFPKDFLVRLDPNDLPPSKKPGKKN
jgi:pilus assembly protein CpaC